jgi:hypothetical protein
MGLGFGLGASAFHGIKGRLRLPLFNFCPGNGAAR